MHNRFHFLIGCLEDAVATDENDSFYLRLHFFRFLVSAARLENEVAECGLGCTQSGYEAIALIEVSIQAGSDRSDDALTAWMSAKTDANLRSQAVALLYSLSAFKNSELFLVKTDVTNGGSSQRADEKKPLYQSEQRPLESLPSSEEKTVADKGLRFIYITLPFAAVASGLLIALVRHKRFSKRTASNGRK